MDQLYDPFYTATAEKNLKGIRSIIIIFSTFNLILSLLFSSLEPLVDHAFI